MARISRRYLGAVHSLYGDKAVEVYAKPRSKLTKEVLSEAQEQIKFVAWLTRQGIRHAASANGGKRDYQEACKFKLQGVSPGWPDLTIPYARKSYHGLYIEIKRVSGGVVSSLQKEWLDFLNKEGYLAKVARGAQEAIQITKDYFDLS